MKVSASEVCVILERCRSYEAVPELRLVDAGLLPWRLGFNPG
jgi:hypothetical protein